MSLGPTQNNATAARVATRLFTRPVAASNRQPRARGEDQDRYVSRLFADVNQALGEEFETLSKQVFLPLLDVLNVEKLDAVT